GRVLGQDLGVRWHQQHIVEGERFSKKAHEKAPKNGLYPRGLWQKRCHGKQLAGSAMEAQLNLPP
ncbi:hypothetical protein, partial [Acidovorax soli]|uniref:hypothetical protein n=1 Tax=Acidovorax soli TaxID=592050 RepID=UPI0032B29C34